MDKEHQKWLATLYDIIRNTSINVSHKYAGGQSKHGGNMREKNALRHLRQEVWDLVTYSEIHNQQVNEAIYLLEMAKSALLSQPSDADRDYPLVRGYSLVDQALCLLRTGYQYSDEEKLDDEEATDVASERHIEHINAANELLKHIGFPPAPSLEEEK